MNEFPTKQEYLTYISQHINDSKFDESLYERDKTFLNSMKTLFCKDIDALLSILESQRNTLDIPRIQSLFITLLNSGMGHLQKVSEHMRKIQETNNYILDCIQKEINKNGNE